MTRKTKLSLATAIAVLCAAALGVAFSSAGTAGATLRFVAHDEPGNFALDDLREAVRRVDGRLIVEASGGVRLENVAAIAATGVDVISSGALTHSALALDIGLDVTIG